MEGGARFQTRNARGIALRSMVLFPMMAILLSGCGMGGMASAVRTTGESFDRAECMARDLKGEADCKAPSADRR